MYGYKNSSHNKKLEFSDISQNYIDLIMLIIMVKRSDKERLTVDTRE